MNPRLKNLFFSLLSMNFENVARKAMKEKYEKEKKKNKDAKLKDCGKLLETSFIVTKEKTIHKLKYEHYEGESLLTKEEKLRFAKMVSIDIEKEETSKNEKGSPILDIIYIANVKQKTINIFYTYQDKTTKQISL